MRKGKEKLAELHAKQQREKEQPEVESRKKDEIWMGDAPFTKGNPELFEMDELEVFDIDYPWQFEVGEVLYDKFKL